MLISRIFSNLRASLILIVIMAIAPSFFIAAAMNIKEKLQLEKREFENSQKLACLVVSNLKSKTDHLAQLLTSLSDLKKHQGIQNIDCGRLLQKLSANQAHYVNLITLDKEGRVLCSADPSFNDTNFMSRTWLSRAIDNKPPELSALEFEPFGTKNLLCVASPWTDAWGRVQGVMAVMFDLSWIKDLSNTIPLPKGASISVVDSKGNFISRLPEAGPLKNKKIPGGSDLLPEAPLDLTQVVKARGMDGVERLYSFHPLFGSWPASYFVRVGIPSEYVFAAADERLRANLIFLSIISLLAVAGAHLFSSRFIKGKAKAILDSAKKYAYPMEMDQRLGVGPNGGEFEQIAAAFDVMASSLKASALKARTVEDYISLIDKAPLGLFRTTVDGRFLRVNQALAEMFGFSSPQEMIQSTTHIGRQFYMSPKSREEIIDRLLAGDQISEREVLFKKKSSDHFWGKLSVRVVKNRQGDTEYLEGYISDISNAAESRSLIRHEKARLYSLLNEMPAAVALIDSELKIRFSNRLFKNNFGNPNGKTCHLFFKDNQAPCPDCPTREVLSNRVCQIRGEVIYNNRTYITHSYPYETPEGRILALKLLIDITERKNLENRLKKSTKAAKKANRTKSDFLVVMSHELRSPMNAIITMNELTLDTELDPKQRDYISTSLESAKHLLAIINEILDFSKADSGKIQLQRIEFNLESVLDLASRSLRAEAERKGLKLVTAVDPEVPVRLEGDPGRLRQVIINLLANAIKFTDKGEINVNVCLAPDQSKGAGPSQAVIDFSVADTGVGVPKELHDKIFTSFYQADSSLSRSREGTGLGLAISRRLAGLMNGDITMSSEPGKGSVFTLSVPFAISGRDEPVKASPAKSLLINTGPCLNILAAEDDSINIKVTQALLSRLGHRLTFAPNGEKAVSMLAKGEFDLVLMDVNMPLMNGIEACARIRKGEAGDDNRDIPIIAMTAHILPEVREECLRCGMTDFISKPINAKDMAEILAGIWLSSGKNTMERQDQAHDLILDKNEAIRRMGGDKSLYSQVLKAFFCDAPHKINKLRSALQAGDKQEMLLLSHSLKSNSATVGAEYCRAAASILEKKARENDLDGFQDLIEEFETRLAKAKSLGQD